MVEYYARRQKEEREVVLVQTTKGKRPAKPQVAFIGRCRQFHYAVLE
jgi:hypothetical protein